MEATNVTNVTNAMENGRRMEKVCLYVAALAAGSAFSILFTGEAVGGDAAFGSSSLISGFGGGAFVALFGAALVAAAVGSAGRFRFVLLFPAAVVYTLLAVYGFPPLTLSGWRSLFEKIGEDIFLAANTMYAQPVPYDLAPGLLVILVPMVMVIVAFATSATLYERTPIISVATLGLTIGVLSTISFEDGAGPFFFVFVFASLALLLFSGAAGEGAGLLRPGLISVAVVAALVLLIPMAPFSNQTVSPGAIDWTRIGTGGTSRLDVQADVGDYLTAGRDAELMRVSSTEALRWRGGTLDRFDGVRWTNTTRGDEDDGEEIAENVPTRSVVQSVQILDAETNLIFGGYKITDVSNDVIDARENPDGSWRTDSQFSEGDFYRVLSEVPQPTTEQLQSAGANYPSEVRERFLQLPEDTPGVVGETADEIQANYNISTPYDAARAVERYLVSDGGFTYNLDVSYRRADWAIEEFLGEGREGFCTQFATSMALILRDMDIPTRVVYGATPGERVDDNVYEVTGANMHTWVEVYFPGVGWYPMDPTPGFGMPQAMQANAPAPEPQSAQDTLTPENPALRERNQQMTPDAPEDPEPQAPEAESGASSVEGTPLRWPLFALAGGLVLISPVFVKRALLARGRPEDMYRDLSCRLRDALPPSVGKVADARSLTVNERMALLAGACGLEERPFVEFSGAYSDHLYARRGDSVGGRQLARSHRRAVKEFEKLPGWRRALAAVNPTSLFKRLAGSVSSGWRGLYKKGASRVRRFRER